MAGFESYCTIKFHVDARRNFKSFRNLRMSKNADFRNKFAAKRPTVESSMSRLANFSQSETVFVALLAETLQVTVIVSHSLANASECLFATRVAEWHAKKQWKQRAKRKKRFKGRRSTRSTLLEEATGEESIYEEGG
ncbi:hypothetical protein K0M31_007835 [Melipona bicolor]|uniref:Uncharacterized protein n=1 Tax=Melipona bicolor TaxID=60889 RepID=A0AA40GC94_9HYME|nr:hypothetical protein K0M31_007835 [Melipona bicolor]